MSLARVRWRQVPAKILHSQLEGPPGSGNRMLQIEYEYAFEGIKYRETKTMFTAYPVGANVPLLVNPRKPTQSILGFRGFWAGLGMAAVGFVLIIMGVFGHVTND